MNDFALLKEHQLRGEGLLFLQGWNVVGVIELGILQKLVDAVLLLLSHESHESYPFLPKVLLGLSREIVGELSKVDEYTYADNSHQACAALLSERILPPIVSECEEHVEVRAHHDLYKDGNQVLVFVVNWLASEHQSLSDHRKKPEREDLHFVVILQNEQDEVSELPSAQNEDVPVAA